MIQYPVAYEGKEPYIFVSYSHKDSQRVLPLIQGMIDQGFRVWYDKSIQIGSEFPEYIEQFLQNATCVLPFMSENALESRFCRDEINYALNLDKNIIVTYLEKMTLKYGLGVRLSSRQAIFLNNYKNDKEFLQELCKAKLLQSCRRVQAKPLPAPMQSTSAVTPPPQTAPKHQSVSPAKAEDTSFDERLKKFMGYSDPQASVRQSNRDNRQKQNRSPAAGKKADNLSFEELLKASLEDDN